ncbi:hypothetical protein [Bradyrhizobium sp. AUGA SZCCT0283]|jgi:hypothetical protein|uniref:hypothetical protein n=1 Tax=Bradyrhizobium sp. AUGA SZCCT0283 TaxID=2807671 RepID=UPI001BA982CB|nr:hypothetical protein [Bradyrhizobium sp. AUGA SZCCT0283]MBR1279033.1 hypothetical protein [Bradyrhizobium sp. AUGA SZCCT0283]
MLPTVQAITVAIYPQSYGADVSSNLMRVYFNERVLSPNGYCARPAGCRFLLSYAQAQTALGIGAAVAADLAGI